MTLADMSPISLTHQSRTGCVACPSNENGEPGCTKTTSPTAYGSATVGRRLGRRSLDTFSSIRVSFKGRQALTTTTNATVPALKCGSAGSSPVGPAKQKWFDSLRGKSSQIPSQIPTPSSPTSMSSTLKRSRFFRSSPVQPPVPDLSLNALWAIRAPLPKLEIASFQSELQRMSIFGEVAEIPIAEAGEYLKKNKAPSPRCNGAD